MVIILVGTKADPLIGGSCDRVYEPCEEDQARAILFYNSFKEDQETGCWSKVVEGGVLRARIKKTPVSKPLSDFPN